VVRRQQGNDALRERRFGPPERTTVQNMLNEWTPRLPASGRQLAASGRVGGDRWQDVGTVLLRNH
jgi:hypothetical protein